MTSKSLDADTIILFTTFTLPQPKLGTQLQPLYLLECPIQNYQITLAGHLCDWSCVFNYLKIFELILCAESGKPDCVGLKATLLSQTTLFFS